jgi:protocatechuate 3,4-dioxygenase beta subunit
MKPSVVFLVLALLATVVALIALLADFGGAPPPSGGVGQPPAAAAPPPTLAGDAPAVAAAEPAAEAARSRVAAAPGAPRDTVSLRGRLLVQPGVPARAVRVRHTALASARAVEAFEPGPTPTAETESGEDGRFQLEVPRGKAGRLTIAGQDLVFADVGSPERAVPAAEVDLDLGELRLIEGAAVSGEVRDAQGRALEGVEVSLAAVHPGSAFLGFAAQRASTDADGRFAFRGLRGAEYSLTTASPHHLPETQRVELTLGAHRDDVVFTLSGGHSIRGVVVDDQRRPVEGATVGAFRHREPSPGLQVRSLTAGESVQTDEAGRFVLGGIGEEPVTLRARKGGHAAGSRTNVSAGGEEVVLLLPRLGGIEGVLVDGAGAPIAGSRITVTPVQPGGPMMRAQQPATTDAEGRFAIRDVEPGEVIVRAEGDGHVPAQQRAGVRAGETTRELRVVASRGATLAVLVVDAAGSPVEGAVVSVTAGAAESASAEAGPHRGARRVERRVERRAGGEAVVVDDGSRRRLGEGTTGADGRVEIAGLPRGAARARAQHPLLAPSPWEAIELPAAGAVEATLALRQGGAVELVALDADRQPLAGAAIEVRGPEGRGEAAEAQSVTTSADGTAEVAALAPGSYTAALRRPMRPLQVGGASIMVAGESQAYETSRVAFVVRAGETVSVTLLQPALTALEGTLSDASGAVVGGTVELEPEAGSGLALAFGGGHRAVTDGDGRFRIEDLTPGRYRLRYARRDQIIAAEEPLEVAGERLIERHLELRAGAVSLLVLGSDAQPLAGANVTIQRSAAAAAPPPSRRVMMMVSLGSEGDEQSMELGPQTPSVHTGEDGRALLRDVPPGRYVLTVEHASHVTLSLPDVEVEARGERDLGSHQLAAGGALRGRILNASAGEAPTVATVEYARVGSAEQPKTTTAVGGGFRLTGLAPGRYSLRARVLGAATSWGAPQEVEVQPGATAEVSLEI